MDPRARLARLRARVRALAPRIDNQLADLGELAQADCEDQLPSGRAWVGFVRDGDPEALASALGHTALRATLIGTGLWLAGGDRRTIFRDAIAGSVGIDAFIIGWTLWHTAQDG